MRGNAFLRRERVLGCVRRLAPTIWAPIHHASSRLSRREGGCLSCWGVNDICLGKGRNGPTPETDPHDKAYDDEGNDWRFGAGGAQESARGHQSRWEGCYYFLQWRFPQLLRSLVPRVSRSTHNHPCGGGKRGENKAAGMTREHHGHDVPVDVAIC